MFVDVTQWRGSTWGFVGAIAFLIISTAVQLYVAKPVAEQTAERVARSLVPELTRIAPAIQFGAFRSESASVISGGRLAVIFEYDVRDQCHTPAVHVDDRGEFYFKVAALDEDGEYRRFWRLEPGQLFTEKTRTGQMRMWIDLPTLHPGKYALKTRAVFHCSGEHTPQLINAPMAPFEVKAPIIE